MPKLKLFSHILFFISSNIHVTTSTEETNIKQKQLIRFLIFQIMQKMSYLLLH